MKWLEEQFNPNIIHVKQDAFHAMNRILREYAAHKTLSFQEELSFRRDIKMLVRQDDDTGLERTKPTAEPKVIVRKLTALKDNYNLHEAVVHEINKLIFGTAGPGYLR